MNTVRFHQILEVLKFKAKKNQKVQNIKEIVGFWTIEALKF